jgi:Skp family chaperone for outer membrane proteins
MASVAALAMAFAVTPAMAERNRNDQSTSVVVINYQRVVAETALGRDMQTKLQGIRTQIQTEAQALQPEEQSLEQERQRLATASRNMTPDQVRANATLSSQFQAFQQRAQQLQARGQALQGDLQCSQLIALRDFGNQVTPIIRTVSQSRGAGVAVDAGSAQFVDPAYDITTTVIQQVDQNQATRVANVARHAVSECQGQTPAAGQ